MAPSVVEVHRGGDPGSRTGRGRPPRTRLPAYGRPAASVVEVDLLHQTVGHRDQLAVEPEMDVTGVGREVGAGRLDDPSTVAGRAPPRGRSPSSTAPFFGSSNDNVAVDAGRGPLGVDGRAHRVRGREQHARHDGRTDRQRDPHADQRHRAGCGQAGEAPAFQPGPPDPPHPQAGEQQDDRQRFVDRACVSEHRGGYPGLPGDGQGSDRGDDRRCAPRTTPINPTVLALEAASSALAAAACRRVDGVDRPRRLPGRCGRPAPRWWARRPAGTPRR